MTSPWDILWDILLYFCEALIIVIFIRSIMSLMARNRDSLANNPIFQITEPLLVPLRRILPRFGKVDISPFVAIIILMLIIQVAYVIKW